jgi:signal transduction histidine kinase
MVANHAAGANIKLVDQIADQPIPDIWTDSQRFLQVMLNLLSNAIKYNRESGEVIVSAMETKDAKLRISVTDNGYGIPKNKQEGLFEPFNRLGRETGEIEGTGIGLTISKQLVELLDGQIGFESEKDVGSTFWVELPIATSVKKPIGKTAKKKHLLRLLPNLAILGRLFT